MAVEAEDSSVMTVGLLGAVIQPPFYAGQIENARLLEIERRILQIEARLDASQDKIGIAL